MENNKYLLAMMAAKRAKELSKGAKPLVESKHRKPTIIALEEIKAGKVYLKEKEEPLKAGDVFHEEGESLKAEEPAKVEDISSGAEEPAEITEIFNENEKSEKPED
ncbi:MAG TPA: DNA-directed RNA polymerase subunit omega [Candidatus Atribacteria bacterium]|nr:DNA-directed RNA polymerase subunit omega [Candidatus Atribacteria bacterium]